MKIDEADIQGLLESASRVAGELGETSATARLFVGMRIVAHGVEIALATLEEAKEIQAGDGMLRQDGSRRTLGGVFVQLMKRREEKEKKELKEAQRNMPKPPPDPEKEAALAAKKAAEKALAAERRAANRSKARSKAQRAYEELMERYRAQKAALLSAREELEKEKETREKLEAELVALRAARPPATQHRTRPGAPPGRVYRAPGGGR